VLDERLTPLFAEHSYDLREGFIVLEHMLQKHLICSVISTHSFREKIAPNRLTLASAARFAVDGHGNVGIELGL
jgi:hypothetical protein